MYSAATFQPSSPKSSTSATSFTIGAEIRNEKVTPSGTPVVTNPMNSGTAEQEQKGVTMPSSAASTLPADSRLPARTRRVRSGVKNERTMPTPKTTSHEQHQHLGRFVDEELHRRGGVGARLEAGEPIGHPPGHAREVAVRQHPHGGRRESCRKRPWRRCPVHGHNTISFREMTK